MAQRTRHPESNPAAEALEELEQLGDRIARFVAENPRPVMAAIGAVLLAGALAGALVAWQDWRDEQATAALEAVRTAYLEAMGAGVGAVEIPEPANPETAKRVREDFAARFAEVAEGHGGTAAATLALLEAADLRQALGQTDAALAGWRQAAATASADSALRALLEERIAQAEEAAGRFTEAAEAWTRAGEADEYPLRWLALGHAARCWLEAGDTDRAREIYGRIKREAPQARLPEHVAARLRELPPKAD